MLLSISNMLLSLLIMILCWKITESKPYDDNIFQRATNVDSIEEVTFLAKDSILDGSKNAFNNVLEQE